jgi:hypothetical protein
MHPTGVDEARNALVLSLVLTRDVLAHPVDRRASQACAPAHAGVVSRSFVAWMVGELCSIVG